MVLRTLWSKVKSRLQWEEFKQKFSEKPEMEVHIYFAPKIIVMWRLDFVPITFPIWYIEFKSWKSKFKICWGRVPLVEQDLLVLPEHLSTSQFLVGVHFAWSLVFCQVLSTSLYVLFLLVIVLSCPLIYGFWLHLGIFKLFFGQAMVFFTRWEIQAHMNL